MIDIEKLRELQKLHELEKIEELENLRYLESYLRDLEDSGLPQFRETLAEFRENEKTMFLVGSIEDMIKHLEEHAEIVRQRIAHVKKNI